MSTPTLTPAPRHDTHTGSHCASRTGHRARHLHAVPEPRLPEAPQPELPGIGVGTAPQILPAAPATPLSRYRVRADRPGLNLRAGEIVLCAAYEPVALGMVVLVRCESDGHAPGALLSVRELELIEHTEALAGPVAWSVPGVRD
ncbi:hypothetical protein [Kocuria arenosa]|uniref:hypothetical protein n=1 Tax=Kocuria arenosa TaxID=3071446 RepID=UPI0034D479FA